MAVAGGVPGTVTRTGRRAGPPAVHFVRLKLRLVVNGFRGRAWRVVVFGLGLLVGLWLAGLAVLGLAASGLAPGEVGYVASVFTGTAVLLGWTLLPLLFFGVDETIDPARFALLPVPRMSLVRGMLAAAFAGVPALATLLATLGLVVAAAIRFGPLEAAVALLGVLAGLVLAVVASRAVTSAFAGLLRSRRVRDLAAVLIAVLASSVAPVQLLVVSAADRGSLDQARRLADVLAWTPFGAPHVLPYDVAAGRWPAAAARCAITVAAIVLLLWWWSSTIESAMLGAASGGQPGRAGAPATGAVSSLVPRPLRGLVRPTVFGAVLARESRYWWRDPRRRSSLISILMASAVLPVALNVAAAGGPPGSSPAIQGGLPFGLTVTMAGTLGGMVLANQFAFDGSAFATHVLAHLPGRVDLRARALALALVAVPVQLAVVGVVGVLPGNGGQAGQALGLLVAGFGAAVAVASMLSVLAAYPLPDNANPFALNAGAASAKGLFAFAAMIATLVICAPLVGAAWSLRAIPGGQWLVLASGLGYGFGVAWLGTHLAGRLMDRRGPELLAAVTPRR